MNGNQVKIERRFRASDVTPASSDPFATISGSSVCALTYVGRGTLATEPRRSAVSANRQTPFFQA